MEIQQSETYRNYVRGLGWESFRIEKTLVIWRKIPVTGAIAKIQRTECLPEANELTVKLREHKIRLLAVEPGLEVSQKSLDAFTGKIRRSGIRINLSPFIPTKTIRVPLSLPETEIFRSFTDAKRRGIKKAQKLGVRVTESKYPDLMIRTKNRSAGPFGFITTYGIRRLFSALPDSQKSALLAYLPGNPEPQGCIFLIFWDNIAWYWIAGATKTGKKAHIPTLLVWEALKTGKKYGMTELDFAGVWDERMPNANREWLGFTRFKEGFGGIPVYYPFAR